MPSLLSVKYGPSTKDQIEYSFKRAINSDYNLLILGNSRVYRGLNPAIFHQKSFNFSHDNDSYNQSYYKLKLLLKKKKQIDFLILGIDYFQFSFFSNTRNYIYGDYLGDNYLKDFDDNILRLKIDYYKTNINPNKLFKSSNSNKPFIRENGQFINPGVATKNDTVSRDINRLDIHEKYFEKIINLCRSNNIKLFLVMPPVREIELKSYNPLQLDDFDSYINRYSNNSNIFYLNYSEDNKYKLKDYTDVTHLNEDAANRFSKQLNDTIPLLLE